METTGNQLSLSIGENQTPFLKDDLSARALSGFRKGRLPPALHQMAPAARVCAKGRPNRAGPAAQTRFTCPTGRPARRLWFKRIFSVPLLYCSIIIKEIQRGRVNRPCPKSPWSWPACRRQGRHRRAFPAQRACTGWSARPAPSWPPRRPAHRTTWS